MFFCETGHVDWLALPMAGLLAMLLIPTGHVMTKYSKTVLERLAMR